MNHCDHRVVSCCALLFFASLAACGDDDDAELVDASIDAPDIARVDASFPGAPPASPDGLGWCCVAEPPSCDCRPVGGFVTDPSACSTSGPCDFPPADFHLETDAHGCRHYTTPIFPTVCGCLCRDSGIPESDAGVAESDGGSADDAGL